MKKLSKKLDAIFTQVVPWEHIEARWGKQEYKRFLKWMRGQTAMKGGAYLSDVESYAVQRNAGRLDPIIYD